MSAALWTDEFGRTPEEILIQFRREQTERCLAKQARYDQSAAGRMRSGRYHRSEKGRAVQRKYEQSELGRAKALRYDRVRRERYPQAVHARLAVNNAIITGRLVRPVVCSLFEPLGEFHDGRIEAHHHNGYGEECWLDVVWLCFRCHKVMG